MRSTWIFILSASIKQVKSHVLGLTQSTCSSPQNISGFKAKSSKKYCFLGLSESLCPLLSLASLDRLMMNMELFPPIAVIRHWPYWETALKEVIEWIGYRTCFKPKYLFYRFLTSTTKLRGIKVQVTEYTTDWQTLNVDRCLGDSAWHKMWWGWFLRKTPGRTQYSELCRLEQREIKCPAQWHNTLLIQTLVECNNHEATYLEG